MRDLDLGAGVVVALHGHGDEPGAARRWAREIAPANWEIVAPGAGRDDDGRRSWFSTGPRGVRADELDRSVAQVTDVVERVGGAGRRVAVVGFSQGGAVALELAARGCRADGIVAMSAFLPEVDDDTARTGVATPLLVIGAAGDDVVPPFLGADAATHLGSTLAGGSVEHREVDGGHEVGDAAAAEARRFLESIADPGPRFSMALPVERVAAGTELVSGAAIADLAAAYERLGYHAAYVTDHPAPDDRWLAGGGHHALEPTVALAVAAAATRRLRLHTNIYVLGYRNPFLAAKALASLDVVSEGRLIVGVAAGYLRPEFAALGASFDDRGARLDEMLELLPRIWTEEGVAGEGSGWSARSVTALPRPAQQPHPPIWVGGNSVAAMRRAVTLGQGWSPFPTPAGLAGATRTASIADTATLARRLEQARRMCEDQGRTEALTTCFAPFGIGDYLADPEANLAALVDEVAELTALGLDWITLMVPGHSRNEVIDHAAALADALGLGG